jgi:hypothetical protein
MCVDAWLKVCAQGRLPSNKVWSSQTQEDNVNEFDDLEKKARAYAEQHPEQAGKGIDEVANIAERDSDHQHDEQIDRAVDAVNQHLGQTQAQDQQDDQN